jgi:hypothetical protein
MHRWLLIVSLVVVAVAPSLAAPSARAAPLPALARIDFAGSPAALPFPVHAVCRDSTGRDYALVIAAPADLARSGRAFRVLADDATARFVSALPVLPGAREAAAGLVDVVHDDGARWLVRVRGPEDADRLNALGFALAAIPDQPIVWEPLPTLRAAGLADEPFVSNAWVAAMVGAVTSNRLMDLVSQWSGEEPAACGQELRAIPTRRTDSGAPLRKALEFGHEYLQALGLAPVYHTWSGGYVNSNLVATQVGTTASNELILITAHLDSYAWDGYRSPGADDNASGSAAVLAAASVFSQCQFERTIRYVLFTGEEQGLLGSTVYAAAARAAGDNIVAVVNLDMIGWDGSGGPTARLYIRSTPASAYSNDLPIARAFTNVVAAYGLQGRLAPVISPDSSITYSDHSPFWNNAYPALLGIEDYGGADFNPYYHQAGDNLAHLNIAYFTAFAQAAIGTVAHLAKPVGPRALDVLRVVSADWSATNGNFGATVFHARHASGAAEGSDAQDLLLSALPPRTNAAGLLLATQPTGTDLAADTRPTNSQSLFRGRLAAEARGGATVSCTNRLRFTWITPPAPDRLYSVRVAVDGAWTAAATNYLLVTNLADLTVGSGLVELPPLVDVPSGTVYGACDIGNWFLDTAPSNATPQGISVAGTQAVVTVRVQAGTRVADEVGVNTDLVAGAWTWLGPFTNEAPPNAANFETGWVEQAHAVDVSAWTNAPALFLRTRRTWLAP